MSKVMSREQAVALIQNGATVAVCSGGGGVMEPYFVLEGIEKRFLETGSPKDLFFVHAAGFGNKAEAGASRFAHKGMVRRVLGGHWVWSPQMQQMANNNDMEAYCFSQGVICQLYREIAAHRPGLVTKIGKYTFVDPRVSGGKLNDMTKEDLVEIVSVCGTDYLFYKSFPIDIAVIRGTCSDSEGNISMEQEASRLDNLAAAQAAHNSGGVVIAQVKYLVQTGTRSGKDVIIPGAYVDAVVVDPEQKQSFLYTYQPAYSGDIVIPLEALAPLPLNERKIIARRAYLELEPGAIVNLGFGMPDGVANVATEEGFINRFKISIEQGIYGGVPAQGSIFGVASNPEAMLDECAQFDFYSGHGLDIAFLGMAQADRAGNVNVSKFGSTLIGTGGFIDISQSAKKVVFCGSFTAGGLKVTVENGRLVILQEGRTDKFVRDVEHLTFSARYAKEERQKVVYVTERAVFELRESSMVLTEIAPGVDLAKDIFDHLGFRPVVSPDLKEMDPRLFQPKKMGVQPGLKPEERSC